MAFERRWIDRISGLGQQLRAGLWQPRRAVCFTVTRPKVREIHAPDFADRVVHHWLVPRLEALFEPRFIHDSYANRRGRGSHAAVQRLQRFSRQVVDGAGAGKGWYLQLDIRDFFYSIHRQTLYSLLKRVLSRRALIEPNRAAELLGLQSLCHKLLARPTFSFDLPSARRVRLPPRKRLQNAPPGYGLPIGNLSSQFFANVYLNELDQFVKGELRVKHYLRYVDDFILLAPQRGQLEHWREQISTFLRERLLLEVKPAAVQPIANGIDFLGYRSYPHHRTVRRRVVGHCRQRLDAWGRNHVVVDGGFCHVEADTAALQRLRAQLASYLGHFSHADSHRLRGRLSADFPWLALLFDLAALHQGLLRPRWRHDGVTGLHQQLQLLREEYPECWIAARCGVRYWVAVPANGLRRQRLLRTVTARLWRRKREALSSGGRQWLELTESGYLRHGGRLRTLCRWHLKWIDIPRGGSDGER